MEINVLTPSEAFYWAASIAIQHGAEVAPRGMKTLEVQNVTINIQHPGHRPDTTVACPVAVEGRELRPFIGAVEALQLVGQVALPEIVVAGSASMAKYRDDGLFLGAYGQRIYGQLSRVERLLASDNATRQAVLTIYEGRHDLDNGSADVPCTLTIQFLWQGVRLGMRVSMRSNDVWLGLPYDLEQFTALQTAMCDALGVEPGVYTHTVGSLHAYESNWDAISTLKAPAQPESHTLRYEPRWSVKPDGNIASISSRARSILLGNLAIDLTDYEVALADAVGWAE